MSSRSSPLALGLIGVILMGCQSPTKSIPEENSITGVWTSFENYTIDDGIDYADLGSAYTDRYYGDQESPIAGYITSKVLMTRVTFNLDGTGKIRFLRQAQHIDDSKRISFPDEMKEETYKVGGEFPMWYEGNESLFHWTYRNNVLSITGVSSGGRGVLDVGSDIHNFSESDLHGGINNTNGTLTYVSMGDTAQGAKLDDFHLRMIKSCTDGDWHNTVHHNLNGEPETWDMSGKVSVAQGSLTSDLFSFMTQTILTFNRE